MKKTLHFVHKEPTGGSLRGRKVYTPADTGCCVGREYFWALPITDDTARGMALFGAACQSNVLCL